jgi:hypothetical protein
MADSRTKSKTAPRVAAPGATDALGTWGITVAAGVVATLAATATSLELVAPEVGLATAALALLVLLADSTLRGAVDGDGASPLSGSAGSSPATCPSTSSSSPARRCTTRSSSTARRRRCP